MSASEEVGRELVDYLSWFDADVGLGFELSRVSGSRSGPVRLDVISQGTDGSEGIRKYEFTDRWRIDDVPIEPGSLDWHDLEMTMQMVGSAWFQIVGYRYI